MQTTINSAAPNLVFNGTKDVSGRALPPVEVAVPMHCPLFMTFAPTGEHRYPVFVDPSRAAKMFGSDLTNETGRYATIMTPYINRAVKANNKMMLLRLRPDDATDPASVALSLEVLATEIPLYERNPDGSYKLDSNGAKKPTGASAPGYKVRWLTDAIGVDEQGASLYGMRKTKSGIMTDGDKTSTVYPIADIPVRYFGAQGNNTGIAMWSPTVESSDPINESLVESQRAYVHRIALRQRANDMSTPTDLEGFFGEHYIDFTFKPGTLDKSMGGRALYLEEMLIDRYTSEDANDPLVCPFEKIHLYQDNLQLVLKKVQDAEKTYNTVSPSDGDEYMVNLLTGINYMGVPYHTLMVEGVLSGGLSMTESSTHYAQGGSDGTMTPEVFEKLVAKQLETFGRGDIKYGNMAKYPFTDFYDPGFSLATKKLMPRIMSVRPDVFVTAATQVAGEPLNTEEKEAAVALDLLNSFQLHPDSANYNTPAFRFVILGQAGRLMSGNYRGIVPMTVDLLTKRCKYMGNDDGRMDPRYPYDTYPHNVVTELRDVANTFKDYRVRNREWANGLTWVEDYDMFRLFYPGIQTGYTDDTSVLNAEPNARIVCVLNRICFNVWRSLTGTSKLTSDQLIERSNELIKQQADGIFDNRVVIVPNCKYTKLDKLRGYSWTCEIDMYGNNMKTVMASTIITHRKEELEQ